MRATAETGSYEVGDVHETPQVGSRRATVRRPPLEVVEGKDLSRVSTRLAVRARRCAGVPKCEREVADIERDLPFEGPRTEVKSPPTHLLPIPEPNGSQRSTETGSEVAVVAE